MRKKLTADQMPMLRTLREVHLQMIDTANKLKRDESDIGMLLAYGTVIDQLHDTADRLGRDLSRLERSR